jgi:hypothetical protein
MCKERPRVTREGGTNIENFIIYKVECACGKSNGWHTRGAAVTEWNNNSNETDEKTSASNTSNYFNRRREFPEIEGIH